MKIKKVLIIALVQTMIFVGGFAAKAMAFGKHHQGHEHNIAVELLANSAELKLGPDQINTISAALATYKSQRETAMTSLRTARKNLRAALTTAWQENKGTPGQLQNSITSAYVAYYNAVAQFKGEVAGYKATMMSNLKKDNLIAPAIETLQAQHKQKFLNKITNEITRLQALQSKLQQ